MTYVLRVIVSASLIGVTIVLALPLLAIAGGRFEGYVAGVGSGKGHSFIVGNGLNLVFIDHQRSHTPYRVCWTRGSRRKCWTRTTGSAGRASKIFTPAPTHVAGYATTWYVRGRSGPRSSPEGWHCVGPQTGYASCRKSGNKLVAYF
jgi:hypothetical protein